MLHEIVKINLYLAVIMLLSFTLSLFPIPLLVPVAFVKVAASEMCVCKHFKLVMGREEQWLCVSPRGEGGIRVSSLLCRVNQSLILGGLDGLQSMCQKVAKSLSSQILSPLLCLLQELLEISWSTLRVQS